jgi:hypothetical protein
MLEAIRLVKEEQFSIKAAAVATNTAKANVVPRMTLSDRLKKPQPDVRPILGWPQE